MNGSGNGNVYGSGNGKVYGGGSGKIYGSGSLRERGQRGGSRGSKMPALRFFRTLSQVKQRPFMAM